MAIPNYQEIMLPLIRYASDEQEHDVAEAYDNIAQVLMFPTTRDKNFYQAVKTRSSQTECVGLCFTSKKRGF